MSDALLLLEALPRPPAVPGAEAGHWPGVADPDALRALLADWLSQYANAGTRRTYAYALGLPVAWADAAGGVRSGDVPPAGVAGARRPEGRLTGAPVPPLPGSAAPESAAPGRASRRPPPAAPGPLHHLAWFRWCAARGLDPREVTGREVKTWLHALAAAGAQKRTRQRMLSTLSALYAHLAEAGAVPANPAALDRSRLGLSGTARDSSPTIRLTAAQLAALLRAAAALPHRSRHRELYARRAVAVVGLLTLGLRVSELTGLDRDDVVVTGGDTVLRVLGKGGVRREVYLTELADEALRAYLAERDRAAGAAVPARRGRAGAAGSPLIATRSGTRCSRFDLHALLRRIAAHAGPELAEVADRIHPHALRHAYVTIALERDARIQHVQADVGHATVATTQHYDRGLRTRASTAADLVAAAIREAVPTPAEPSPQDGGAGAPTR